MKNAYLGPVYTVFVNNNFFHIARSAMSNAINS